MIDADRLATRSSDTDSLSESEFKAQYTSLCMLLADAETDTDDGAYWAIVYENQLTWLCEQNPKATDSLNAELAALRNKDVRHNTHLAAEALLRGMSNAGNY